MDIKRIVLLLVAALVLAGCSAVGKPRMIATFPSGTPLPPAPRPGSQPYPAQFVYNASLALRVSSPSRAAERAGELAYQNGGYLAGSHSWVQDGQEVLSVAVAVPVYSYDTLHAALLTLGTLESENIWGEWVSYGADGVPNYSQITVEFRRRTSPWGKLETGSWKSGTHLRQRPAGLYHDIWLPGRHPDLAAGGGGTVCAAGLGRAKAIPAFSQEVVNISALSPGCQ